MSNSYDSNHYTSGTFISYRYTVKDQPTNQPAENYHKVKILNFVEKCITSRIVLKLNFSDNSLNWPFSLAALWYTRPISTESISHEYVHPKQIFVKY